MAEPRDRPYGNFNFVVVLSAGARSKVEVGVSEVVFPTFMAARARPARARASTNVGSDGAQGSDHLVLRRGFTGALDLYAWWNETRSRRAAKRRTVEVRLLAEDHATVATTWRFHEARPVSLGYSPLRSNESGLVIESLELAFGRMDML
jgi:phage tail-like protein